MRSSSSRLLQLSLCLAVLVLSLAFWTPRLSAQDSAAISGIVTDPSGATVSMAAITAKNVETGSERTTMTDPAGLYRLLALPVGRYEVRVTKDGFREVIHSGIHLVVGQQAMVDFALQVGEVSEQVTVTADAPIVSQRPPRISPDWSANSK